MWYFLPYLSLWAVKSVCLICSYLNRSQPNLEHTPVLYPAVTVTSHFHILEELLVFLQYNLRNAKKDVSTSYSSLDLSMIFTVMVIW